MTAAEQTVTWLITLGVLESPKKSVSDPEAFLQASLRDGAVLVRLLERLRPGDCGGRVNTSLFVLTADFCKHARKSRLQNKSYNSK